MIDYAVMPIKGRTGNDYNLCAMKDTTNDKPHCVVCDCLGYKYRKNCWHSKEYSTDNEMWKNAQWKQAC